MLSLTKSERPRRDVGAGTDAEPTEWRLNPRVIAPKLGWRGAGAGRAANTDTGNVYLGTTVQVGGLYPWVLGGGLPPEGVPVGYDLLTHELVCLDPAGWVGRLLQNPGVWIQAQPGAGKSALVKRVLLVYAAYGHMVVVPGDVKGEYTPIVSALGGQVVRVGRGLAKINPLDSGPLKARLSRLPQAQQATLREEIAGRRADLLHALLATQTGLGRRPLAPEANAVNGAVRLAGARLVGDEDPVIPDIIKILRDGPDELRTGLMTKTEDDYRELVREVTLALENLCSGPLAGLFDGPTTVPLDLDGPAVCVDLSGLLTAGDQVVAAGLLATWAYSYAAIDAARALGQMDRQLVLPLDEMWRALRAGPGMVDAMDSMTRLNRSKGEVTLFVTHSLRDLGALAREEDRAKALGLMERCDTLVIGASSHGELERISAQRPLTDAEMAMIADWSAATGTGIDGTSQVHPGRGKYMVKIGGRAGIPIGLDLTDTELALYDTDKAMRSARAGKVLG